MTKDSTKPCPFCAETILIDAKKCKHCSSMLEENPTVIELTSKSIKKRMIISFIVGIMGWFVLFLGGGSESDTLMTIGVLMIIGGTVSYFWAKISRWWHHS